MTETRIATAQYVDRKASEVQSALDTHTHTREDIVDFPTSMPPAAHTHADENNGGIIAYTNISGRPLFSLGDDGILTVSI